MKSTRLFCIVSLFIAASLPSRAAIVPVNSYHLGDLDGNFTNGTVTAVSQDYIGTNAVACIGNPSYSTDVPPDYPLPDTYSMNFAGTNYAVASGLTNVTDSFGIQAWVKAGSTGGNRVIAYNGSDGTNGWGLFLAGDTFRGSFGGVTFIGSAPAQTNVWTHLALVRDSGMATLYVNGVPCGTNSVSPIAPDGAWTIGASPLSVGGEYFDGLMDEVQVFTFTNGFSTNDLAYRPPGSRRLSAALSGTNFVINWPAVRSDMQLQYTTNLASGVWATMAYSTNSDLYTATDAPGDSARFYRLVKPPVDVGGFIISRIPVIRHRTTTGLTTTLFPLINNIDFGKASSLNSDIFDYTFDASAVANPRTGTAEAINYHWTLSYQTVAMFTDAGIHGYHRSMLHIDPFALAAPMNAGVLQVTLDVSDKLYAYTEYEVFFIAQVTSGLSLQEYTACQQPGAPVCSTCACTDAAATLVNDPNDPP